jgi:N-acetylmuramoyl-L-alanine amidase CwlA
VAWHSGNWDENQRSIGIEHSAQPGRDATAATIATSVDLIVTLCRRHNISPDRIYPHSRFTATQCPGTLPVQQIIDQVRARLVNPSPTKPPTVRKAREVFTVRGTGKSPNVYISDGVTKRHIASPAQLVELTKIFDLPPTKVMAQATLDAIPEVKA